ncbi:MAG TPA: T9SS type A sorting domain-containing protein [Bacteroidia bacterium]|nr:T9SS type A sorting domain-containing protein [Bacteroidia bacterium]
MRVTGSTPNIGLGPLTVRGVDSLGYRWFVCGSDTVSIFDPTSSQTFTCPNGDPNPHQLIFQRVYHKNGTTMDYYMRPAGTMTYHPSHGHNHVDEWGVFTLRIDNGDPNPLNWPIVGQGQKMGFCLMDYGQCGGAGYVGHCRDTNMVYNQGNTLINADFPNFNLGGGGYGCSQFEQGISSGWTDVYGKHLDGMWINIPPGTCNGNYYIVVEIDRNGDFLESDETNNWTAVPITLILQNSSNPIIEITADRNPVICDNESITLIATAGTNFLWSNGDTTQSITVSAAGTYSCAVTTFCGTSTATFDVYSTSSAVPVVAGDTACVNNSAVLTATGSGTIRWRDGLGQVVGTGTTFVTPPLSATTTYYAENVQSHSDTTFATPHTTNMGSGSFVTSSQYLMFTVHSQMTLMSVLVDANTAGNKTIQLQDSAGAMMQTITVSVSAGESRVALNWSVAPGKYRLAGTGTTDLYRNNGGVNYPFSLPGVLDITGSSGGAAYYYFFYDWEVATTNETCTSTQVAVDAVVDPCLGIAGNPAFSSSINLAPNPNDGSFVLQFNAFSKNDVHVYITDVTGRVVYTEMIQNAQGEVSHAMDLSFLSKGVYFVNVGYEEHTYTNRMIVR